MSNKTSISLTLVIFVAGLAGIAWAASGVTGYRVGSTIAGVIAAYILLLIAYACGRRVVVRIRARRARGWSATNGQN